jgi:hypothetical protein
MKRVRRESHDEVLAEATSAQREVLLKGLLEEAHDDITLVMDDGSMLSASRAVLSAGSDYFKALLSKEKNESSTLVNVERVSQGVLSCVLRFLSGGDTAGLTKDNAEDVMLYADYCRIMPLIGACRRVLATPSTNPRFVHADNFSLRIQTQSVGEDTAMDPMWLRFASRGNADELGKRVGARKMLREPDDEAYQAAGWPPRCESGLLRWEWPAAVMDLSGPQTWPRLAIWREDTGSYTFLDAVDGEGAGKALYKFRLNPSAVSILDAGIRSGCVSEGADWGVDYDSDDPTPTIQGPRILLPDIELQTYTWPPSRTEPPPVIVVELRTGCDSLGVLLGSELLLWEKEAGAIA